MLLEDLEINPINYEEKINQKENEDSNMKNKIISDPYSNEIGNKDNKKKIPVVMYLNERNMKGGNPPIDMYLKAISDVIEAKKKKILIKKSREKFHKNCKTMLKLDSFLDYRRGLYQTSEKKSYNIIENDNNVNS